MLRVAGRRLSSLSWKANHHASASTILSRNLINGGDSSSRSNSHLNYGFSSSSTSYAFLHPIRECKPAFRMDVGSKRFFSEDIAHSPTITDPDIEIAYKDLMAVSWDELPDSVILDVKIALSKDTDDKTGKEVLINVFRAAEAVEHFTGVLVSLRMGIDDCLGISGENVRPLSQEFVDALGAAYKRYTTYLSAFGPEETYLRKKVETELGTRMIHLKQRCSGLESEWGKVSVLGTSGIAGSYIEHRA